MSSIPQEILEENILTRLPVKSISRFRCVCKYWCNNVFKNSHFTKMHLQHAIAMNNFSLLVSNQKSDHSKPTDIYICSFDHNVFLSSKNLGKAVGIDYPFMSKKCASQLIGSCNGLVCIELYGKICIWNPYTKEYRKVPATPIEYPSAVAGCIQISYGFGLDRKSDDYKLLRIVGFAGNEVSEAKVYTLRSNSWKSLGFIQYDFSWDRNRGHLVNGVLHWIAVARRTGFKTSCTVVSFDISNEIFRDTALPDKCWINRGMSELGTWEGKLCLVLKHNKDDAVVWTMKDYSWSKQIYITEEISDMIYGRPIQIFQNGEILFESYLWKEQKVGLISYDPKLRRARVLKISSLPKLCEIEPYIGTLVSLNSGTFLGQEQLEEE
ncbi:hypothetical protein MKX01_031742 [Papaver californicum]|nr:hypothetical protein MKX01_031742 [Papaver californicum]